jgi:ureidoglycolate lyase
MRVLHPVPLTQEAFQRFGDVVSIDSKANKQANQGSAKRADFTTALVNDRASTPTNVAVFRSTPRVLPFEVRLLERHPFSSQLFSPLQVSRYVVVVAGALGDGTIDEDDVHAFVATNTQAINYKVGTWHHPLLVLGSEALFLMVAHEDGSVADCEECSLQRPWLLEHF